MRVNQHAWGLGQISGAPSGAPMSRNLTDQSPAVLVVQRVSAAAWELNSLL